MLEPKKGKNNVVLGYNEINKTPIWFTSGAQGGIKLTVHNRKTNVLAVKFSVYTNSRYIQVLNFTDLYGR